MHYMKGGEKKNFSSTELVIKTEEDADEKIKGTERETEMSHLNPSFHQLQTYWKRFTLEL